MKRAIGFKNNTSVINPLLNYSYTYYKTSKYGNYQYEVAYSGINPQWVDVPVLKFSCNLIIDQKYITEFFKVKRFNESNYWI